jgi:hypothetical protein
MSKCSKVNSSYLLWWCDTKTKNEDSSAAVTKDTVKSRKPHDSKLLPSIWPPLIQRNVLAGSRTCYFIPSDIQLPCNRQYFPSSYYISALFLTILLSVFLSVHSEEGAEIGEVKSVISFTYWKPFKSSNYEVRLFPRLFGSKAEMGWTSPLLTVTWNVNRRAQCEVWSCQGSCHGNCCGRWCHVVL